MDSRFRGMDGGGRGFRDADQLGFALLRSIFYTPHRHSRESAMLSGENIEVAEKVAVSSWRG